MEVISDQISKIFSVQGRLFDATTNNGIGGLLVTAYDVNNGSERTGAPDLDALLKIATRVGSVLSDETGKFVLNYDKDDIVALDSEKRRIDLLMWQAAGRSGGRLQAPACDVLRGSALREATHEGRGRPPFAALVLGIRPPRTPARSLSNRSVYRFGGIWTTVVDSMDPFYVYSNSTLRVPSLVNTARN